MDQMSLFDNAQCTVAVQLKKQIYADVYDLSFYCMRCGAFISHPAPKLHKGKTCGNCGRLITSIEYTKER